ncbi:MAG TPA: Flp pilus assembly protein CpaB [Chloroflexota bacterium]|nr:Flp pilus assembly protein CpaB [Chloroflexota bacterium]
MKGIGGKGVLALSLVLGIATSYMVYQYVDQAGQAAKPVETVPVLTAAQDIPARTTITGDMLRLTRVPVDLKLPNAMVQSTDAVGKVSKLPISQGEEMLPNKLFGDREESGLAFVVPEGKRAVSVAVNEVVGSGGMIVPSDYVDVVAVLDVQSSAPSDPNNVRFGVDPSSRAQVKAVAQYVLQNVEVLAVAQALEGDPAPQTTGQKVAGTVAPGNNPQPPKQNTAAQPGARTVTLAVGPEDAEKLVLAEDKGRIRLVLRAHGDNTTLKVDDNAMFQFVNGVATLKSDTKPL